jgi:hypothetical protein
MVVDGHGAIVAGVPKRPHDESQGAVRDGARRRGQTRHPRRGYILRLAQHSRFEISATAERPIREDQASPSRDGAPDHTA